MSDSTGKKPQQSKKWLYAMFHSTLWKVIVLGVLWLARNEIGAVSPWLWWFAIVVVITAGMVDLGWLGGQTWIDRYLYVAKLGLSPRGPSGPGEGGAGPSGGEGPGT